MKHILYSITILLLIQSNFSLSAQHKIQAQSANEFLNSIGVNSAIYRRGENVTKAIECIKYLGARWIRTDEDMNTDEKEQIIKNLHEQTGVKISTSLGSGGNNIAELIAGSKRIAALGALLAIEGNNEPNNWGITYQGKQGGQNNSWIPVARLQRDMYAAIKADPILKSYPIWTTTETGAETDNVGLQYIKVPKNDTNVIEEFRGVVFADAANCHNYFVHPGWKPLQNNQTWLSSDPSSNAKGDNLFGNYGKTWAKKYDGYTNEQLKNIPRVTTETGATIDNILTEEMQARLYLSCYLAQYAQGWSHTAMYIMRDRSDEEGNQSFGFYDKNYNPRQAAHYLHNMTAILKDDKTSAKLGSLSYTIPNQPETVHDLLLQKSDKTFMLVVWGELYAGGTENITIKLGKKYKRIDIYDPTTGETAIKTLQNADIIPLTMTNHPYILKLK
ncbi:MAG: glycosyl hydrolase [Bacteroidaceae bacterium]|nr:glycosyl hydrolase [Bacteroidaceae bacterium]